MTISCNLGIKTDAHNIGTRLFERPGQHCDSFAPAVVLGQQFWRVSRATLRFSFFRDANRDNFSSVARVSAVDTAAALTNALIVTLNATRSTSDDPYPL